MHQRGNTELPCRAPVSCWIPLRSRSTELARLPCDGVDLNFDSVSQSGLNGGARRTDSGKKFSVHPVESAEILNVSEMACALHYVSEAVASALQDLSDVVERQSGLFFNRSADHGSSSQVQRRLSANEKPAVDLHPCRI